VAESAVSSSTLDWTALGAEIRARVEADLFDVMVNSYTVWVPVGCINFKLIPTHLRVVFIALAATGWNAYLSLVQHKEQA
jgi:hypothetical protein